MVVERAGEEINQRDSNTKNCKRVGIQSQKSYCIWPQKLHTKKAVGKKMEGKKTADQLKQNK